MRLDLWLSKVCLIKTRNQAKNGCASGKVLLNGAKVKESHPLKVGEELSISFETRELRIRVLDLPTRNVAKKDADKYYEILSDESISAKRRLDI